MKKTIKLLQVLIASICLVLGATSTASAAALTPIKTQLFLMVSSLKDKATPYSSLQPFVKGEAQLAWDYYSTRRMQQMYARLDETGVVILWQAANITEARQAIEQMPMVKAGLIGYKLTPVKYFSSLSSLFNTGTSVDFNVTTVAKAMQFVLITRPANGASVDDISASAKDQALAIWQNYQTGIFRQMFDIQNKPGSSAIIMTADNIDDATQIVEQLPLVKNMLIEYDLIPVGHFFPFSALF